MCMFCLHGTFKQSALTSIFRATRFYKMKWVCCLTLTVFIGCCNSYKNVTAEPNVTLPIEEGSGQPLLLTPLIESGDITLAQNKSKVTPLIGDIVSYAGYLTVDKRYNSNLFFWFFPAANNNSTAPVLLWLAGGPGSSSLGGLFNENGPFYLNKNGSLELRKQSWSKTHSVIYVDNPVGTGFSFTDKYEGYSTNEVDIGKNLYTALVQFFKLFPEYQKNDFFVTGESYAGKYVPAVSYTIHNNNPTAVIKINLKGLAMGSPYCDPEHMSSGYGDYFYQLGLIDEQGLELFRAQQKKIVELIKQQKWIDAFKVNDELLIPVFFNLTGFKSYYNYLQAIAESPFGSFRSFIQKQDVSKKIHVGNSTFDVDGTKVYRLLMEDYMQSVRPWVETLLENYRVLVYSGQLDLIVAYPYTVNFLKALNWSGAGEYKTAKRNKWFVEHNLAGYSKTVLNLTELLVRNAGHFVPKDQPVWALDMITRFTSNTPF